MKNATAIACLLISVFGHGSTDKPVSTTAIIQPYIDPDALVYKEGGTMTGYIESPEGIFGDLSVTNLVVHGTGAWTFLVPTFFSNAVDFGNSSILGVKRASNDTSAVSYGMLTDNYDNILAVNAKTGALISTIVSATNGLNNELLSPYQAFSSTVVPGLGGTCTIAYANGSLVKIYNPMQTVYISFDVNSYTGCVNGIVSVAVMVYSTANDIYLDYSTCTNEATLTKSTTAYTRWMFMRVGSEIFKGRQ